MYIIMYILFLTDLDHLLDLNDLQLGLEEASSRDNGEDDPKDDLADLTQLLHALALKMTLQMLTIENLKHTQHEDASYKVALITTRHEL